MLVPGYTGSKEDFLPLLPLLAAAGHRAVAIDLPGQHESGGPEDPAAYTIERLAKDVAAVAAVVGDDVHLVGHSFGGLVCRRAVITGLRPATLALVGSGPAGIEGNRRLMVELMRPLLDDGGVPAVWAAAQALEADDPRKAALPEDVRQFLQRRFLASPAAALRTMGEQLVGAPDEVDALAAAGVPVLVTHGEGDDAWPPAVQRQMAERLEADYVSIAGALHSPACEAPDALAEVLVGFWRGARG